MFSLFFVMVCIGFIIYKLYFKGNFIYNKHIESSLEQKHIKDIEKIQYTGRRRCNYINMTSAALLERNYIMNCYVYYYDIYLKDNVRSKAYILEKDGKITAFDETIYISIDKLINKYKEVLNLVKIEYNYEDISSVDVMGIDGGETTGDIYSDISELLAKKHIILKVDDMLSSQYINNFLQLNNVLKQYVKSNNDLKEIYIHAELNNGYFNTYIRDDNDEKQVIMFEKDGQYNIIHVDNEK